MILNFSRGDIFSLSMMLKLLGEMNFFKYRRKVLEYLSHSRRYSVKKANFKVLFFGTDNFSLPSIKELHNLSLGNLKVSEVGIVTSFKNPANCIKCYAIANRIPAYKWPVDEAVCRQFDMGIVVSFGHMIPENIIKSFPLYSMINVHASILPRWRGAAPIIFSIMKGDAKTGVSLMKIEPNQFDVGEIYAQKEIRIDPHVLMPELHDVLAKEGASLLRSALKSYPESFKNPQKQNENEATYARKIVPAMAEVNWRCMSASEIYNLYRALYGFKHLTTKLQDLNIKLVELGLGPTLEENKGCPGSVEFVRSAMSLRVQCKDNTFIDIVKVKVDGKRTMTAVEFNNGFLKKNSNVPLVFK